MARNKSMETWIYYFEDPRGQEQVVPDGVVLSFNINRYKCDHVNFWNQKQEIINADCVMLQSPVKKCIESVSNHSVTFVTPEPYLVFSLFTNRFLTALMLLNETQSLPGPLSMFDKANCSSTLNFVRQQINGSYLVTVSYTSTCPFSPDHWSIHLEQKCRTRVPHNEIKNVNSDSEQIVQHECGFLETPNYPFAYQNYEEPLVWIFDPLQSRNESESLSHYYEFSLDVFTLDVCLNSKLLMSESINGSFSKETTLCGYKKGEKFSTISSRRLLLMFLASKISQTSSSYQGFSISFKLKQDASRMKFEPCSEPGWISFNNSCYAYKRPSAPVSWDEASMECSRLGGHLVSIQSQDEMNAIKQMLLYEWHSEAFAHPDVFIYIGLRARPEVRTEFRPTVRIPQEDESFNMDYFYLSNNFEWSNGEPFVFHEWFPSHYETVYSRSSPNVQAFINEEFPQPSNDPNYPCVGMMLHNPRHHSNWIKVPCNIEIKGQSHICERSRDDNHKVELERHFNQQLEKIRAEAPTCADNWIEHERQCYMLLTLNSSAVEPNLTLDAARLMCERLGSQIATMPKEVSKQKPFNQMLRVWRYSVQRGRIFVFSSDRNPFSDYSRAGSDDDLANAFNPVGFSWIHDDVEAPIFHENRRAGGEIGRLPTRSVLCERSPVAEQVGCRSNQFACLDGTCISSDGQCDGKKDCPSGEDEMDCSSEVVDRFFECNSGGTHLQRISWSRLCDHKVDCSTGLDEADCQFSPCKANEFQCERTKECIPNEQRCNGISSCQDLTDEQNCETCNGFQCLSGRCIPNGLVNDTQVDCPGSLLEDEAMTCLRANNCTRGEDVIDPGSRKFPDCPDSQWERCMLNHVKCFPRRDACVFDRRQFGKQVCPNMEHLRSCVGDRAGFGCRRLFQCPSGYCIPVYRLCDGVQDCSDGADEIDCSEPPLLIGHLRCRSPHGVLGSFNISVPAENSCDGIAHCRDGEDEAFCDMECRQPCNCRGYITECLRPLNFNINQTVSPLTRALYLSGNTQVSAKPGDFDHLSLLGLLEMRSIGLKEIAVGLFFYLVNLRYLDLSNNEISIIPGHVWAGLVHLNTLLIRGNPIVTIESFGFAHLPLVVDLDLSNMSIASLPNYFLFDSNSTRHLNLSRNPLKSIEEMAFTGGPHQLNTLDLSGTGQDVYIPIGTFSKLSRLDNLYTDSFKFCCLADGIAVNCTPPADGFSSCDDLLGDLAQQVMVWIFGCLALFGNLFVIAWRVVKKLLKKTTDFLILNLSLADLLMGVYLLIIAGTDTSYRHIYIAHDDQWRASSLCTVCAILATISSEVSVTILAFLSYDRYKLTVQRFKQHGWTLQRVAIIVGSTWLATCSFSLLFLSETVRRNMPYNLNAACSPFYLDSQIPMLQRVPQFVAIVYNCAAFAFMTGCYLRVFLYLKNTRRKAKRKAMDIDHLMARRLFLLVLTDLICWLPTIVLFLLVSSGYKISRTTTTGLVIFALPINSALNPYLYTVSRLRMFCRESKEKLHRRQALETISAYLENRRRLSSTKDLTIEPRQSPSQSQTCAQTQTNFGFEFDEPVQLHHRANASSPDAVHVHAVQTHDSADEDPSDGVFL
ncbi:hypothetical protein BOX15_Mlig009194g3 [Macrostomum lignano]|uniref:G_PROTEIN_RECEP_F1_2 domain-containing protein n=1 Tax=Macrostomum lignano TaxID=282301 RepID=A0A267GIT1_9PLAT|nr:hypothetical protein BOX15_Mlig009194g3 [Macrostomum lignano]